MSTPTWGSSSVSGGSLLPRREWFAFVLVALLAPERADACGGLFCSNFAPAPIDQSAERILFEVLDDGTVSATVEIRYQGEPADFSWIVPVGGTPLFVEVGTKEELNLLDAATRPQIIPPQTNCSSRFGGDGGGSWAPSFGCPSAPMAAGEGEGEAGGVDDLAKDGVNVTEYPSVGPYDDIVVVDGTVPQILMDWLNEHNYRVTEEMRPFIEQYTLEGYSFLATKLQPNADTQNMAPIRFHCPQPYPEIPLRLTAIAAEPEMGFLVFVAANERFMPANYAPVTIDPKDVRVTPFAATPTTNYYPLVSKRIDEEGGLGFVTERAQPATAIQSALGGTFLGVDGEDEARAYLETVLARRAYVTRFYGRMSADEMIEDPEFIPFEGAPNDVDGTIDLSGRVVDCEEPTLDAAPACGNSYCGDGDACGVGSDGDLVDGCICRGSHVARATTGPNGALTVMCTSRLIDLHGGGDASCAGVDCQNGNCVPVNDRPTCECDEGNVAILDTVTRTPRCVPLVSEIHEPASITWKEHELVTDDAIGDDDESSGCSGNRAGGALSLILLFASAVVPNLWRRRASRGER
jgi:hypothetical protein